MCERERVREKESVCVCVCIYHGLINRVGGFIWKDTCGKARNDLHHPELLSCLQHVVINKHIIPLKQQTNMVNIRFNN